MQVLIKQQMYVNDTNEQYSILDMETRTFLFFYIHIYVYRRTFNWTIKSINIFPFYQTLNNQNNENSINKSINKLSLHPD